jgi:hypothetical protein
MSRTPGNVSDASILYAFTVPRTMQQARDYSPVGVRALRYRVKALVEQGEIRIVPNLHDMRVPVYVAAEKREVNI